MEVKRSSLVVILRVEEDRLRLLLYLWLAGDPGTADLFDFRRGWGLLFGFVLVLQLQQHG